VAYEPSESRVASTKIVGAGGFGAGVGVESVAVGGAAELAAEREDRVVPIGAAGGVLELAEGVDQARDEAAHLGNATGQLALFA